LINIGVRQGMLESFHCGQVPQGVLMMARSI
jgi:hypothetical protein